MRPAGDFGAWLESIDAALAGTVDADVPCGDCTGCCTSSQFVLVEPTDTAARGHIPAELLFPAPGLPGHHVMGYDARGHCPMLDDGRCTIYEHRPRTCRTYDCRVFTAAGIEPDESSKVAIAERVRQWRFTHPTPHDERLHDAVRAAAAHLVDHGPEPDVPPPPTATHRAVVAVRIRDRFLTTP